MTSFVSGHSVAVVALCGAAGVVLVFVVLMGLTRLPPPRPRIRVIPLRSPAHVPRAAVVINPTKIADIGACQRRIGAIMSAAGWAEPLWLVTTADDTGRGMARQAVGAKVEVVFVCGGDGTVRAAAAGLMGSGVPLALLPTGTGNLLVRNLRLPMDFDQAVHIGLFGTDHAIDVGLVDDEPFTVMAGIGFDAAIMADAPEKLKRQVGWPAYVVSGLRHLRDRRMHVTLRLDGGAELRRRARAVVIGNVGALQAGVQLLPDARPDDGVLDVVVLAPASLIDWARVGARVLRRRTGVDHRLEHFQARSIEVEADRSEPRELDGDLVGDGTCLSARVEPRALLIRVPVTWSPDGRTGE